MPPATVSIAQADSPALHELAPDGVFTALGSAPRGLSPTEAAARLSRCGPNELPRRQRRSLTWRFAAQFTDLLAVVLQVSAAITLLAYLLGRPPDTGNLELAVAIVAVVVLNAAIGFGQEHMAERTAEALQAMVPHQALVIRDGERVVLPTADLVVGDVLVLEAGNAVPADCRVVEAHELTVNTMALTGESDPAERSAEPVSRQVSPLEARNLLWMGTTVAGGDAKAVVTATGGATEFGRICRLTDETSPDTSPLQQQVALMARRVAGTALSLGVLLFLVRLRGGDPLIETFIFALGVMVALVPEGLPATLSVTLAVAVRRMARRRALIKKLVAVETLGSTTVICTDKTGTLTKAEMTVQGVWSLGRMHGVTGVGYSPDGAVEGAASVRELLRVAALCCNARLLPPQEEEGWRVLGDTTEGALLVAAAKAGVDVESERAAAPRVGEFPFDSTRKLMTTVHRHPDGLRAYVKGAPQELLARCSRDQEGPLRAAGLARILAANDEMARSGLRVLAVAVRSVDSDRVREPEAECDLTFLGLVGMLDPPRPEVVAAVDSCRRAGIRIVMVTGDYALTAEAIARRVGILGSRRPVTVTGAELDDIDDAALRALLAQPGELLFARVKPEHKMRIVAGFSDAGEVVAVTGDGANDAPALRRADIGISMGRSGTDVAREASVMVLLDDSFASIAAAVELGRSVYQNIRKFLIYLFSHNMGELVPILAATFAGFPLVPLTAVQILAIDLGSDVLPALALGSEPPDADVMDRPPRRRSQRLFSAAVIRRFLLLGSVQAAGVTALFFWHVHGAGIPFHGFTRGNEVYRQAITMTQGGIVVSQFFNGLTVRSDRQSIVRIGVLSNPRLIAAECIGVAIMCVISYAPPMQAIFGTAPLAFSDWVLLAAVGSLVLVVDELRKATLRHHERRQEGTV